MDGRKWTTISTLAVNGAFVEWSDPGWIHCLTPNQALYRHYRLWIEHPLFHSLSELRLYAAGAAPRGAALSTVDARSQYGPVNLTGATVRASSANLAQQGPGAVFDGDLETYWHVAFPTSGAEHWISVELPVAATVDAVAVTPRAGHPEQFWNGDALVEGSQDGEAWVPLVALSVSRPRFRPLRRSPSLHRSRSTRDSASTGCA